VKLTVRLAGKSFKLRPGEQLWLGRHESNQLPVEHETVSRFHAAIHWDGSQAKVIDHGSLNGTYVSGLQVDEDSGGQLLWNGAELQLGDRRMHLQLESEEGALAKLPDSSGRLEIFSDKGFHERGRATNDQLRKLLVDYESNRQTGTFKIEGGEVVFSAGRVVMASCGGRKGSSALRLLLQLGHGDWTMSSVLKPGTLTVDNVSVMYLLRCMGSVS
jgi:hypothetical protein